MFRVLVLRLACGLPALLAAAGHGAASSLVTLPAASPGATPSITMRGEAAAPVVEVTALDPAESDPANAAGLLVVSPSMIASGPEAIPASGEPVASIDDAGANAKPRWMGEAMPLVIRGGVAGDAFTTPAAASAPSATVAASAAADDEERERNARAEPEPSTPAAAPTALPQ